MQRDTIVRKTSNLSSSAASAGKLLHRPTVGVVLSGGGAKGLSHVGVLKALEENNIPIDYICGTSMGAIVAGLYAIGLTPDEMLYLFKTKEFESWYKGMPEQSYASYFYKPSPDPTMLSVAMERKEGKKTISGDSLRSSVGRKLSKLKLTLPTSLVSPYPMDLAVMQIFASPCKACKYNFDSLMVPFFCVASDIQKKQAYIARNGDLGSSVRASMTYPLYFKPIMIDSTLLYDGGIYNNFPWELMRDYFHPDYIIGVQCVVGNIKPEEENVTTLVSGMLMNDSDYNIPDSQGIVIKGQYPFAIMDFAKVDEISSKGYEVAQPYIAQIKERITRERTRRELDSIRLAFREKCGEVRFSKNVEITGTLNRHERSFIDRTIKEANGKDISFDQFKRGYYRIIASGAVNTFYPSFVYDKKDPLFRENDSLFTLKIRATKSAPMRLYIGGNISSSSLNQGYLGFSYSHLSANPWRAKADMNLGKFYKGGSIKWRQEVGVNPMAFYYVEAVGHQFDYYNGNQNVFTADKLPKDVQAKELFIKGGVATPVSFKRNLLAQGGVVIGRRYVSSYQKDNVASTDTPDRGSVFIISPMVTIKRSTLNFLQYPTEGADEFIRLHYIYGRESFTPGNTNTSAYEISGITHHMAALRLKAERYFSVTKAFSIGYDFDVVLSNRNKMSNFYSALMFMPAYEPIPHATTIMMGNYRANSFIGAGISPIFLFTRSLYLHTKIAYFRPYEQIVRADNGWEYTYTKKFPSGGFIANFALVWQSPIGPVSLSTAYYSKGGAYKWYPQLNIGFLIFNKKALED
ncbi:MAG: patatin-like phospholipase family protein [Bacteroidales bacterium]|jgi:NTE family protein|nr:patatin-like phospholipase family protein [Bacteroidales bacterium]MCI1733108.1 patatin-like phospholipase family protein [Bacteroidales bacterium]